MIINSENIVDDFLKKISESLPVGEREEYQAWKKDQEKKAANAIEDMRKRVLYKKAADRAYWLSNFFRFDDPDSDYEIKSDNEYIFLSDGTEETKDLGLSTTGRICFYPAFFSLVNSFFSLVDPYKIECTDFSGKWGSTIGFFLTGKRENIGPLYGKLKKLGLNPVRTTGGINCLSIRIDEDEFFNAIKKGLRITDFTEAQSK